MKKIPLNNTIFKKHKVKFAYLFGSRAKGNQTSKSDYDIAVLFDPPPQDAYALKEIAFLTKKLSPHFPGKIDIVALNKASSLLKFEVIAYGKLLYCENHRERINYEVKSNQEYIDDQYMRNIYTHYLIKQTKKVTPK